MRLNDRPILVVGASEANQVTIKNALQSEYKLHFSKTKSDAEKYLKKYSTIIFCIILDTNVLGDIAIGMIKEWYANLDYQLMALVALCDYKDEKMRDKIIDAGTISILSTPCKEKSLLNYIKAVDKRISYSDLRIKERYEDKVKTNFNKIFIVTNAIDCSVFFLKNTETEAFFEYANEKAIANFGNVNFNELLSKFSLDESAKIVKALNQAKGDFEPHKTIVKYFDDYGEEKDFEFSFRQIVNLEVEDATRYVVSVFDRTIREKLLSEYQQNIFMLNSVLDNIKGGICIFRIEDDNIIREYASAGVYKIGNYDPNDNDALRKMLPIETQLLLTKKTLDIAKGVMDGQTAEPFNVQSKITTANMKSGHISINVSVYKKNDHDINVRALVTDNTEEYNYSRTLKHIAEYDLETNLFNNNKFVEATEKLFHSNDSEQYNLMLIRIYKLDEIRSFFGKEKADELLKVVAEGIRHVGKGALKGRVDNKDFAISFLNSRIDEKGFMKKLDEYVKENFTLYQARIYYGIYNVDDIYESVDTLLIQTKFAVKEIEGNAIKNHIFCDAKMRKRIIDNDNITGEMKKALAKGEFEIFLQPVFDLKSRKIVSAEALTRWHHPKRGFIPPSDYIPIFEENGFVVNIDMFVWEGVCKIIRNWLDNNLPAVPISVNVSRIDLFSIDFYKVITSLVEKYDIPIEYIRLEITESAFVLNETSVIEIVDKLRLYGFKILMDDFGSGYSSLNSLKFINVDILKIDMDLVKGIEESIRQADILKSVINLGNTLNLEMICEGVETENQAQFVESNGCKKAQGWLFSKAIPLNEFNKKMVE